MREYRGVEIAEYETMFRREERYWWYAGMRRIARSVAPELYRPGPIRLLDAGCGTGANLADVLAARGAGAVGVGLDLSFEALRFSRRRGLARLVLGSVEALPFRDGSFDAVATRDMLVCVPDDARALGEMARVARPGSPLLLSGAAFDSLGGEHDVAVHAVRRYGPRDLREKLSRAGWRVERLTAANALLSPFVWVARRLRGLLPKTDAVATSDFHLAPEGMNRVLAGILAVEAAWIRRFAFPFGVTLFARARR